MLSVLIFCEEYDSCDDVELELLSSNVIYSVLSSMLECAKV